MRLAAASGTERDHATVTMSHFFSRDEEPVCVAQGLAPPSHIQAFTLCSSSTHTATHQHEEKHTHSESEKEKAWALQGDPMLMVATPGVGVSLLKVGFNVSSPYHLLYVINQYRIT